MTTSGEVCEDRLLAYQLGAQLPSRSDPAMAASDDALTNAANLPWWYRPIRDVMSSGVAAVIKDVLGATKSIPCRAALYIWSLRQY